MYQTKITSQGTISIPIALRRKYNLRAGETVTIEDNGKITVSKGTDLTSLRQMNSKYLPKEPILLRNGDGLEAHVTDKYGKK